MKRITIFLSLALWVSIAGSAQVKTVKNYEDITIEASITEPNTIMLENDRIQQIKAAGNTLIDACNGKSNCRLIDDASGVLTFLPAPLYHTRPFTINLLTENGNFYNVRVMPKPVSSQAILLKAWQKPVISARIPQTSGYEKSMVNFLRALVNGHLPEGFTQTIPKRPVVYKARSTRLKLLLKVSGNQLCGEIFELENTTRFPIDVREASLNWPGTKAIAIDHQHLLPFEKTRMYRIS
ncbi:TPA: type-F conjugative transfer system secretin TraK [Legionella pneumophila]|nr:type-F conjugative transfer system secretin TraK [Legionella pneumophila]HBD7410328.1 type-F conjugative transfer system secretin TraK [Legionella pneumophila]HBD9405521.1 type-F conjugative transfer system secretin TraK [Legionella pneumophila]HBI2968750.1 type-F conjugative transfer system secretin TraK [Legionella pneumophila]